MAMTSSLTAVEPWTRAARVLAIIAVFVVPAMPFAQAASAPAKPVSPAPPKPATASPAPTSTAPEPYSYNPDGRRDPFVSLLSRGVDNSGPRTGGLGGLSTAEITLSGVLQSRGAYIALIKAPDGKTYQAHVNDRLADGTIRSITPQAVVIMQEVNDPLSLVKVKEVRKGLRTSDDVKP
jgi:Tfp pilus assembly protein PilP